MKRKLLIPLSVGAALCVTGGTNASRSPVPLQHPEIDQVFEMLRMIAAVCPIAILGGPPVTDAFSREVSYATFDPDPVPVNAVSREISVAMFHSDPLVGNTWSRELAYGQPPPFEPHPLAWSREVSVASFGADSSLTNAWSRELAYGQPPPFEPHPEAWSREVSVARFSPDPNTSNAWSREVSVLRTTVVVGQVTFQDIDPERAPRFVTFVVKDSTGTILRNANVGLVNGQYQIKDLPTQVLTVSLKNTHWLRRTHTVDLVNGSATQNFSLINGDVDGDNEIGPGDFGILSSAFGSAEGDVGYDYGADLDADGEVGPSDFGILSANFGLEGD